MFPKIRDTPQIIHVNRVFHYFHHPFWGTTIFWKHPYIKYIDSLSQGIFSDLRSRDKWCLLDQGRSCFSERWRWRYFWAPRIYSPLKLTWKPKIGWVVVSNIFYFHPYLGKWSILTNIFQMGWNHQLVGDLWMFLLFQGGVLRFPINCRGSRSNWLWECLGHLGDGRTKKILKDDKMFIPWIYLCWLPSLKLTYSMKPSSFYRFRLFSGWWHRVTVMASKGEASWLADIEPWNLDPWKKRDSFWELSVSGSIFVFRWRGITFPETNSKSPWVFGHPKRRIHLPTIDF